MSRPRAIGYLVLYLVFWLVVAFVGLSILIGITEDNGPDCDGPAEMCGDFYEPPDGP